MENQQFYNSPQPVLSQDTTSQRRMSVSDLSTAAASVSKMERLQLGANFKPSDFSVICGRGKNSYDHLGNHHFRELATMFVARYARAGSKAEKSEIVSEMIGMIEQAEGIFCKFEKGAWYKVDDCYAREKAGALLRDLVQTQQRSPPGKVKKVKKTKAKPARPKFQKQTKPPTQVSDQLLGDLTAGHDSEDLAPSQVARTISQQPPNSSSAVTNSWSRTPNSGHSDDSTMSTWSHLGEDALLGFEDNSLEDKDDYFDMLAFEGDSLEDEDDYFDIFRMDRMDSSLPQAAECCIVGGPPPLPQHVFTHAAAPAAARFVPGVPPSSLSSTAAA
jgi:hypothetical protein